MSPELFEKLKELDPRWKYELCVGSQGCTGKLRDQTNEVSMMKTGKSIDELALWILEETSVSEG